MTLSSLRPPRNYQTALSACAAWGSAVFSMSAKKKIPRAANQLVDRRKFFAAARGMTVLKGLPIQISN